MNLHLNNHKIFIEQAVRQFLETNPTKIMIGTPFYGGQCHIGYFQSMMELSANFTKLGIPFELMTIGNESLIPRARNGIVAKFMASEDATHLLFVDADITFSISVVKLLLADKELMVVVIQRRCLIVTKVKHHIINIIDLDKNHLLAILEY